jgi:hypothetical protein
VRYVAAIKRARGEKPIHRLIHEELTACGLYGPFKFKWTEHPETNPFECWTSGWRPCVKCYPKFDHETWREIRRKEDAAYRQGAAAARKFWDAMWAEVDRYRKAS